MDKVESSMVGLSLRLDGPVPNCAKYCEPRDYSPAYRGSSNPLGHQRHLSFISKPQVVNFKTITSVEVKALSSNSCVALTQHIAAYGLLGFLTNKA
jgi:hypothetical protein